MDFFRFYQLGREVLSHPHTKHSHVVKQYYRKTKDPSLAMVLSLKFCYRQIFPLHAIKIDECVNEYLLDFETLTSTCTMDQTIVVYGKQKEKYCFSMNEILQICKSDLCRSVLIYDDVLRVYTVVKNFRLPHNPYINKMFSLEDLNSIVSQIVIHTSSLSKDFQDVYLFLQYRHVLLSQCANQPSYQVTSLLDQFFETHEFRFQEKYKKTTKENESHWKMMHPFSKTLKDLYYWFIQYVFLNDGSTVKSIE